MAEVASLEGKEAWVLGQLFSLPDPVLGFRTALILSSSWSLQQPSNTSSSTCTSPTSSSFSNGTSSFSSSFASSPSSLDTTSSYLSCTSTSLSCTSTSMESNDHLAIRPPRRRGVSESVGPASLLSTSTTAPSHLPTSPTATTRAPRAFSPPGWRRGPDRSSTSLSTTVVATSSPPASTSKHHSSSMSRCSGAQEHHKSRISGIEEVHKLYRGEEVQRRRHSSRCTPVSPRGSSSTPETHVYRPGATSTRRYVNSPDWPSLPVQDTCHHSSSPCPSNNMRAITGLAGSSRHDGRVRKVGL